VVCLEDHSDFGAIGFYYRDFSQLNDQDVVDLLARFPPPASQGKARSQTSG
jgi:predicted phosphoribosyltransferase